MFLLDLLVLVPLGTKTRKSAVPARRASTADNLSTQEMEVYKYHLWLYNKEDNTAEIRVNKTSKHKPNKLQFFSQGDRVWLHPREPLQIRAENWERE